MKATEACPSRFETTCGCAPVIEAVASDRPYRAELGIDAALRVIQDGSGTIFDAACVDACEAVAPQILARSAQG